MKKWLIDINFLNSVSLDRNHFFVDDPGADDQFVGFFADEISEVYLVFNIVNFIYFSYKFALKINNSQHILYKRYLADYCT